jgi:hypothetical protein
MVHITVMPGLMLTAAGIPHVFKLSPVLSLPFLFPSPYLVVLSNATTLIDVSLFVPKL